MSRYEHGRITAVDIVTQGDTLIGFTPAGVSTLTVNDTSDFDEEGGQLRVNGQVITYTAVDDETGEITLDGTLTGDADEGDAVECWDPLYQTVPAEKIAQVRLDGDDDDNSEPIEAELAQHLVDKLGDGIRGLTGESCLLEVIDGEWRVVDLPGFGDPDTSGLGTQFTQDITTVVTPGDQTAVLSYLPIEGSEHVYWNGLYQPGSQWSRDGVVVTLPDEAELMEVDDQIVVEYAHRGAAVEFAATEAPVGPLLIGYRSDGILEGTFLFVAFADGAQVGDLAVIAQAGDWESVEAPAGWTDLSVDSDPLQLRYRIVYKILDADDIAANQVLFVMDRSTVAHGICWVVRGFTGPPVVEYVFNNTTSSGSLMVGPRSSDPWDAQTGDRVFYGSHTRYATDGGYTVADRGDLGDEIIPDDGRFGRVYSETFASDSPGQVVEWDYPAGLLRGLVQYVISVPGV